MNHSKLKMCVTAIAVLSTMWLVGCAKKQPDIAEQPVAAAPVVAVKSVASVNAEALGLYTGQFEPSEAYLKAKKAYDVFIQKVNGEGEEAECCGIYITELKQVPAALRPYMYKTPLNGLYEFTSPNRLSVTLTDMRDDGTFTAKSIAAGNERDVTGTWEKTDKGMHLQGNEPGDKPIDGKFDLMLVEKENLLIGTWTSNTQNAVPKKFALKKSEFKYDPKSGQYHSPDGGGDFDFGRTNFDKNPSMDVLKTADVENLTQPQIRMIRNLVFARHGYAFGSEDLRRVFEVYDWYTPRSNDVKADLTELEKKNLALLTRYEKYADKHYDEFGR